MLLAQTWAQAQKPEYVWHWYSKAKDLIGSELRDGKKNNLKPSFKTNWHALSWNLAIHFIKMGEFKLGWKLYEHGLQVPAEGPQKWQRSLKKPFNSKQVPLWKGENISGKNLLVLGEQGIGDTMMFASLIPKFAQRGINLYFVPGPRLDKIYSRSFRCCKVINLEQAKELYNSKIEFSYQVPIGSLPQYYSDNFRDFENNKLLIADADQTKTLKNKYIEYEPAKKGRLIGISWQGGGKEKRIPLKSISLEKISELVNIYPNDTFVSLQYGNDKPHLERLYQNTGKRIHHDDTIDPLKDMDGWLAQVAAMDLVISIANTTIHGAGGLGVKTLCLVSNKADWRWMNVDIYKGCYWYQSVDTAYQDLNGSWDSALEIAKKWLA
jgi:ADP-heptose:LPS heptosyltransferase